MAKAATAEAVTVDLTRFSDGGSERRLQRYVVPYEDRMSILTLLRWIYENDDPTLAFRTFQCGRGICNTCRVRLHGKVLKSCARLVKPGDHLVIEPYNERRALRDLASDID